MYHTLPDVTSNFLESKWDLHLNPGKQNKKTFYQANRKYQETAKTFILNYNILSLKHLGNPPDSTSCMILCLSSSDLETSDSVGG